MSAGLVDCASALPERIVDNTFFNADAETNKMFGRTELRRHIARGEDATDLIVSAAETVLARNDVAAQEIDAIFTNVSLPDVPFLGCGAEVKRRLGVGGDWILDVHNTGCVSFVYMLELAETMIDAGQFSNALICNAQTAAGRVYALEGNRRQAQSAIPGDGCGVGLVRRDTGSPVLGAAHRCYADYATDMRAVRDDGGKWWEPGQEAWRVDFNKDNIASIIERGNQIVPEIVRDACEKSGRDPSEIDLLITNQPNLLFLHNWRTSLQLDADQQIHTFGEYANLFGAAIPINLDRALRDGRIEDGDLVCLAGFSHAGDYAAAAMIEWQTSVDLLRDRPVTVSEAA